AAIGASGREIAWDIDVGLKSKAPVPNWSGLMSVQKVIAARALADLRDSNLDAALEGIEAVWRIARSEADRPELISQLTATAQARLAVGLLRKVHGPAYGWESRLREGEFFQSFLAALQNDPLMVSDDPERAVEIETLVRIYHRFADGLVERSACTWTREDLEHS